MNRQDRKDRAVDIAESRGGFVLGQGLDAYNDEPFMLLERSAHDDSLWMTFWLSPEEAADYHDGQEEPENWDVEGLYDLEDGRKMASSTVTTYRTTFT